LQSVVALQCLGEREFCSVDTSGELRGWTVSKPTATLSSKRKMTEDELSAMDLGCTDAESVRVRYLFRFEIATKSALANQTGECVSARADDGADDRILLAHQSSVYLLDRMGANVDIVGEFTLKYDVMGIAHRRDRVLSVAFCPWIRNRFVAGYANGMICLFDTKQSTPMRRFYDLSLSARVLSVSWMRSEADDDDRKEEEEDDILMFALFDEGTIRVLDLKANQQSQSYRFEKKLPSPAKSEKSEKIRHSRPCCRGINSFIAISNMKSNHSFSVHRVNAECI